MYFRYVVWAWEAGLALIEKEDPRLAHEIGRGCAPLAADQRRESVIDVIVGCWRRSAGGLLNQPRAHVLFDQQLGKALDARVATQILPWPGVVDSDVESPPSPFPANAPPGLLGEAAKCESPLERYFLAHAAKRGMQLVCQHPIGTVRLDFAVPRQRLGADVLGWFRRGPAFERNEQAGEAGWRIIGFSGEDVYRDVNGCVNTLASALRR